MGEYQKYLERVHSKSYITDELLASLVHEAFASDIVGKKRIVAGEANEVYDLELSNRRHVIVRMTDDDKRNFEQERWAIEECRKIGVPVPEILFLKHMTVNDEALHVCFQNKLPGSTLSRGEIDHHKLPKTTLRKLINQAGEILSLIHSIKPNGFDNLDGNGRGVFRTFTEFMCQWEKCEDKIADLFKKNDMDSLLVKKFFSILQKMKTRCADRPSSLSHNDYGPKHFMVQGESITGILDFGEICGHSPVNDFSKWEYWFNDDIPTQWLKEGYRDASLFDAEFDELLHWININNGLETLMYYMRVEYKPGVERATQRMRINLDFF